MAVRTSIDRLTDIRGRLPARPISSEETDDMMRRLLAMLAEWEGAVL